MFGVLLNLVLKLSQSIHVLYLKKFVESISIFNVCRIWCPRRDLNPQNSPFERDTYSSSVTGACLVPTSGIEPLSTVLQTAAMTTSARLALFGAPTKNRTWNTSLPRMRYAIYLWEQFGTWWRDWTADTRLVRALLYRWVNQAYLGRRKRIELLISESQPEVLPLN